MLAKGELDAVKDGARTKVTMASSSAMSRPGPKPSFSRRSRADVPPTSFAGHASGISDPKTQGSARWFETPAEPRLVSDRAIIFATSPVSGPGKGLSPWSRNQGVSSCCLSHHLLRAQPSANR